MKANVPSAARPKTPRASPRAFQAARRIASLMIPVLFAALPAIAQNPQPNGLPPALRNVDFRPSLGSVVPLDVPFRDESGRAVTLRRYFGDKPVVLALVYYTCPMLCNEILEATARSLRVVSLAPGFDYNVVAVSFNPGETPADAAKEKGALLTRYPKASAPAGWHLLTGDARSIASLTESAGFRYAYDPATRMYAHASGILVLTPDGKLSRYFSGIEYPARDLQFALIEASSGKIGSLVDHLLLFCYEYNPRTGKYGAAVMRLMQWGAALTLIGLVSLVLLFHRRERRGAVHAQVRREL